MSTPQPAPADDRPSDQHFHHPDQTELGKFLSRVWRQIEPYTMQIIVAVVLVTIVSVGMILWARSVGADRTAGWERFVTSRAPDDFLALANEYPNSPVGYWARLEAGRGFLQEGLSLAMTNRAASDERLNQAQEAFDRLLATRGLPSEVREEALFGMATTLEALSDGDNEPAIQAYEQLFREFPDSRHALWAEHRAEALRSGASREFYTWFRQQQPKPSDRPLPRDLQLPDSGFDHSQLQMPFGLDLPEERAESPLDLPPTVQPDPSERIGGRPASPPLPERLEEGSGSDGPGSDGPALPREFPPDE
jgi:hypothetical protein